MITLVQLVFLKGYAVGFVLFVLSAISTGYFFVRRKIDSKNGTAAAAKRHPRQCPHGFYAAFRSNDFTSPPTCDLMTTSLSWTVSTSSGRAC